MVLAHNRVDMSKILITFILLLSVCSAVRSDNYDLEKVASSCTGCSLSTANINCGLNLTGSGTLPSCCTTFSSNITANYTVQLCSSAMTLIVPYSVGPYCSTVQVDICTPYYSSYPASEDNQQLGVRSNVSIDLIQYNTSYIAPVSPPSIPISPPVPSTCTGSPPDYLFTCINSTWVGPSLNSTNPVVITGPTIIQGSLTAPSVTLNTMLNVTGCLTTSSITYSPQHLITGPVQVLSQDPSCPALVPLKVVAPPADGCQNITSSITGTSTVYVQLFVSDTCSQLSQGLIIGLVIGVIALIVLIVVILVTYWKPCRQAVRPFSKRNEVPTAASAPAASTTVIS